MASVGISRLFEIHVPRVKRRSPRVLLVLLAETKDFRRRHPELWDTEEWKELEQAIVVTADYMRKGR